MMFLICPPDIRPGGFWGGLVLRTALGLFVSGFFRRCFAVVVGLISLVGVEGVVNRFFREFFRLFLQLLLQGRWPHSIRMLFRRLAFRG